VERKVQTYLPLLLQCKVLHLHHRSYLSYVCMSEGNWKSWALEDTMKDLDKMWMAVRHSIWFDDLQLRFTVLVFLWQAVILQTHSNQKEVPLPGRVSICGIQKKNLRKFVAAKKQKNAFADSFNCMVLERSENPLFMWAGIGNTGSLMGNSIINKFSRQMNFSVWSAVSIQ